MTHQQVVEVLKAHMLYDTSTGEWHPISPSGLASALSELGLIKFDKPMTATERALTAINEYARRDGIYIDVIPNGKELIELMNVANVRIVDR